MTQLVFCDLSTPKPDGFNVYDDLRNLLISMGIPENEVQFIHSANTEVKKAELFAKVRSGDVRVLMGSTGKMGAGTNVQRLLVATHHLDCGWKPSDIEQRNGRMIRQATPMPKYMSIVTSQKLPSTAICGSFWKPNRSSSGKL